MLRYEVLFLTVPEITNDEAQSIQDLFAKSIRKAKGKMLSFDRWGKYRLAYLVRKNEYGVYFLVRFDVEHENRDALLSDLKDIFVFKCESLIMKHIFQRLQSNADLEYNRPESLEDNPQDLNDFLKKNEMTGLLKKNPARSSDRSRKPVVEDEDDSDDDYSDDAMVVEEKSEVAKEL